MFVEIFTRQKKHFKKGQQIKLNHKTRLAFSMSQILFLLTWAVLWKSKFNSCLYLVSVCNCLYYECVKWKISDSFFFYFLQGEPFADNFLIQTKENEYQRIAVDSKPIGKYFSLSIVSYPITGSLQHVSVEKTTLLLGKDGLEYQKVSVSHPSHWPGLSGVSFCCVSVL